MSLQKLPPPPPADAVAGLIDALVDVAENSLFAFAEVCEPQEFVARAQEAPTDAWYRATVAFDGPFGGGVTLAVPDRLVRDLCAAFGGFGPEDTVSDAQAVDFVGEMTNMTCGAWLTRSSGQVTFTLAAPRVTSLPGAPPLAAVAGGGAADTVGLFLNDAPVLVAVDVQGA
jgi:Chemotaxis phosphatase CheX